MDFNSPTHELDGARLSVGLRLLLSHVEIEVTTQVSDGIDVVPPSGVSQSREKVL